MKYNNLSLVFLSSLLIMACVNQGSVNETEASETTIENAADSSAVDKVYIKKPKEAGKAISQKDVVMNEAVAISNDFYNNLKNQNYAGANKFLHPDALSYTPASEWTKIYQNAVIKKGNLGFVKMFDYGVKCKINSSNGVGDYAELIFDAQYKDGNMREKLTFFRKDSTEAVKILAYQYNQIVDDIYVTEIFR